MNDDLLKPGEVAALFRVDIKTVARWANNGHLDVVLTLGGHRRYKRDQVYRLAGLTRAESPPQE